jgi:hypothetical protein
VAGAAIDIFMLAFEFKFCFAVVESKGVKTDHHAGHFGNSGLCRVKILPEFSLNFPARRVVASRTIYLLIGAMRVLCEQIRRASKQEKEDNRPVQNDYF